MRKEIDLREWADERGIYAESDVTSQLRKTQEELFELIEASFIGSKEDFMLEWGDVYVTLILAAHMYGVMPEDCVDAAWDKIKNRKGKMKNGHFVKEV